MHPMDAARAGAAQYAEALRRSAWLGAGWAALMCLGWLLTAWFGDPRVEVTALLHTQSFLVGLGITLVVALLAGLALAWYSAIVAAVVMAAGKLGRTPHAHVSVCASVALAWCLLPAVDWRLLLVGPALSLNAWVLLWLGPCALGAFAAAQPVVRSDAGDPAPPT